MIEIQGFSWSPDSKSVVFTSYGSDTILYKISSNGTDLTTLAIDATSPSFSPDGTKILYSAQSSIYSYYSDLYVMNSDGSGGTQLTSEYYSETDATWSRDGTSVIFSLPTASLSSDQTVYRIASDGTGLTALSDSTGGKSSLAFSPNGNYVTWQESTLTWVNEWWSFTNSLCVASIDGSSVTRLTGSDIYVYDAEWMPDSEKLIVAGEDLYRVAADGSGTMNLTQSRDITERLSYYGSLDFCTDTTDASGSASSNDSGSSTSEQSALDRITVECGGLRRSGR